MDYFSVFLLLIIIFTFLSDKKVNSMQEITNKYNIQNINDKIAKIFDNLVIISYEGRINYKEEIKKVYERLTSNTDKQYVIIKKKQIKLTKESIKTIIANYIRIGYKACGFMPSFKYDYINHKNIKDIKHELKVVGINYINIFSKDDINCYGLIILSKQQIQHAIKQQELYKLATYSPSEYVEIVCKKDKIKTFGTQVKEIYNADIKALIKSALLIVAGVTITTNIVTSIYNLNLIDSIIYIIMYWSYTLILKYMYSPIGKYKIVSKYIFPIFLMWYIFITFVGRIKNIKVIKQS